VSISGLLTDLTTSLHKSPKLPGAFLLFHTSQACPPQDGRIQQQMKGVKKEEHGISSR